MQQFGILILLADIPRKIFSSWHRMKSHIRTVPSSEHVANLLSVGQKLLEQKNKHSNCWLSQKNLIQALDSCINSQEWTAPPRATTDFSANTSTCTGQNGRLPTCADIKSTYKTSCICRFKTSLVYVVIFSRPAYVSQQVSVSIWLSNSEAMVINIWQ